LSNAEYDIDADFSERNLRFVGGDGTFGIDEIYPTATKDDGEAG